MWLKGFLLAVLLASGLLVMACGRGPAKTPTPTRTPTSIAAASPTATATSAPTATAASPTATATPVPTAAADPTATPTPAPAQDPQAEAKAYIAKVFPPGPGRDEVFEQCTTCHAIHVIVIAGPVKDKANWGNTRYFHETFTLRPFSEEDDLLWKYLFEHFNEDLPPPPPMPEFLMAGWQNYL